MIFHLFSAALVNGLSSPGRFLIYRGFEDVAHGTGKALEQAEKLLFIKPLVYIGCRQDVLALSEVTSCG